MYLKYEKDKDIPKSIIRRSRVVYGFIKRKSRDRSYLHYEYRPL